MHFPALFHAGQDNPMIEQGRMHRGYVLCQFERRAQALHRFVDGPGRQIRITKPRLDVRDVGQAVLEVLKGEKQVKTEKRMGHAAVRPVIIHRTGVCHDDLAVMEITMLK